MKLGLVEKIFASRIQHFKKLELLFVHNCVTEVTLMHCLQYFRCSSLIYGVLSAHPMVWVYILIGFRVRQVAVRIIAGNKGVTVNNGGHAVA
jgi:hypothetical protein